MIAQTLRSLGGWSWIIAGVVLVGLELAVPGAFLIWLGLAALAAGIADLAFDLTWQGSALAFAALSVVSVLAGRALNRAGFGVQATDASRLNRRGEALVGRIFVLETPIRGGEGRVRVDDGSWRVAGPDLPAGSRVRVVRVEGTTLGVEAE